MNPEHDEKALASAYVLGALERDERAAFEAHVASCTECAAEVRSLERVADALARSVPVHTPRPEVRDRIMASIQARPAHVAPSFRPRSRVQALSPWLSVAASLVAAVLGIYAIRMQQRVETLEARVADAERRALAAEQRDREATRVALRVQNTLAVLAAPDMARIDLQGQPPAAAASGRALWSRARGMVFAASNLPALPAGRVYQVWVVTAAAPVSAGLLSPDASGAQVAHFETPVDILAPVAIAVTVEPAGGVPAPTGEKVLIGVPAPAL
jgi:anti-sigma-K factor RskA